METKLIERYNSLKEEIQNLVKEKSENEKLRHTKFEEAGKTDNVRIDSRLSEIHKEREGVLKEILKIRRTTFDNNFLLISKELNTQPVKIFVEEKIDFTTYTKKATENLNAIYSLSKTFRESFSKYSKVPYNTDKFDCDLLSIGSDFSYSLSLIMKDQILSLELTGYAPNYLNFSENDSTSDVLKLKYVIKLLENKESAIEFFFKKFWEKETRINLNY